ncbi:DUF6702 family protein [Flavobacterium subsaxonicum]|uniref:Peptidase E n=1 Tax=Flavobacterium subsaxonicum WB 4.1-42 = DSM 21790 TaxID=1121898 RepID=A0A0A2MKT4_9FLAO|nr:DUF6702 family protein [Flavobacterium subsaxonicum]KGO92093.1 hypothetical protein Q766_14465 [Flavobacterium subsaxonicum WB 4.1-42 = DSM 21790]
MKKAGAYLVLLILAVTLTAAAAHKFYVSVFQMEYVPAKKEMQITARIFIDDLENGLNKKYSKKLYLATPKESAEAKDILTKYFAEKIHIKINGTAKTLKFLGRETEDDVLICYFTIPAETKVTSVEVNNTLLFEMFAEQQNIIHTKVGTTKKSLLLTNDNPLGTVEF